jgi:hypothetical protein
MQPTGAFGFTCTDCFFPAFGASCANALAENTSARIMSIDFMVIPT